MSIIDNALQALFGLAIEVKTLWENASPTSEFPGQVVPILSAPDYDYLLIDASATQNTGSARFYTLIRTDGEDGRLTTPIDTQLTATIKFVARDAYVTRINPGVRFFDCYYKPTTSNGQVYNTGAVPRLIKGIKLLGGVIHKLKSLAASLFRKEVLA